MNSRIAVRPISRHVPISFGEWAQDINRENNMAEKK